MMGSLNERGTVTTVQYNIIIDNSDLQTARKTAEENVFGTPKRYRGGKSRTEDR